MNIVSSYAYQGKNIYSHKPVIKIVIDLGDYYDSPSTSFDGFTEKLMAHVPNLHTHKCSKGYEGGFIERLREGTYMGHIIEHVAIEIQNMLGYNIKFGKTRQADSERIYHIVYAYINEIAGLEAGILATDLIRSIVRNETIEFAQRFENLRRRCLETDLGSSTDAIRAEAEKRNIPVIRISDGSLLQLGYGKNQKRIQATLTENSSCISVDISCNKALANNMLKEYGIPVPEGKVVSTEQEAINYSGELGFPVVIKPNFGNQGKGVSVNLKNAEEVKYAYAVASDYKGTVLIEKYIEGEHYRLLVVGNKVVAGSQRICAYVTGDGHHTISQLIDKENCNPLRGEGHEKPLTKIKADKIIEAYLSKQGLNFNYIPLKEQIIKLRENDNLSTGGIAIDVTDEIHPDNIEIAVLAAKIIGLDVAGIDITTKDISIPIRETNGALIEINAAPGIRMHHYPTVGKSRNVAKEIVNMLCPENKDYTIPIISVTGTNGKTTTVRMIQHILALKNYCVGMTTTSGVYINKKCITKGDHTGPISARTVLMNPEVEYAVLETARGGIVKRGLGYHEADVGIITNITEDHLGIDGISAIEDLAHIKSLVTEAVKANGYAVLNADDTHCRNIAKNVKANIIYYSLYPDNEIIRREIAHNNITFFRYNNSICMSYNGEIFPFIVLSDIPALMNGVLEYNIYNSLAAAAGAYAIGMTLDDISKGLTSFKSDCEDNPGRFNMFNVNGKKVILDYGHNIDAYKCIVSTLLKLKKNKLIGVIGVPGDRTNSSTYKIGQICGNGFDEIYIKEDKDRRGRDIGEIADILKNGCLNGGISKSKLHIELSEEKALEEAIQNAENDDIIIVFYEEYYPLLQIIDKLSKQHSLSDLYHFNNSYTSSNYKSYL